MTRFAKPMKPKHQSVNPPGHRDRMKAWNEYQKVRLLQDALDKSEEPLTVIEEAPNV